MNALRLVLTGIGVPAIGLIWWWTARRSSQAPGNSVLREPSASLRPEAEERPPYLAHRERTIVPLEPLELRVDEADPVPVLDEPISPYPDPVSSAAPSSAAAARQMTAPIVATAPPVEPEVMAAAPMAPLPSGSPPSVSPLSVSPPSVSPPRASPSGGSSPKASPPPSVPSSSVEPAERARVSAAAAPRAAGPVPGDEEALRDDAGRAVGGSAAAPAREQRAQERRAQAAGEEQRIVALRVCAVNESRFQGKRLIGVLEARGLAFGRYQVFHRRHSDGRSIFCVASLNEPGTFDAHRMTDQEYRGVSLFAVLPGPLAALQAFDEMLSTAREIARELGGTLQDDRGLPLSPQRAAALREQVAHGATASAAATGR